MDERYRWQSQDASNLANQPPLLERLARKLNEFVTQQAKTGGSGNHMHSSEWKVVVKLYGMLEAQALLGRLQAEGIPAQAWQEGAGKALGLTVGYLGEVRVVVPSEFYEEAKTIADIDFSEDVELDDEEWADGEADEIDMDHDS